MNPHIHTLRALYLILARDLEAAQERQAEQVRRAQTASSAQVYEGAAKEATFWKGKEQGIQESINRLLALVPPGKKREVTKKP